MGTVNLTLATLLGLLLFHPVKIHSATRSLGEWLGLQSTALAETEGGQVGGSRSRPTPSGFKPSHSTPNPEGSSRPNHPSSSNQSSSPDATPRPDSRGEPATGEVKPPVIPTRESPNRPGVMPAPIPQSTYPTPQYSDRPYEEAAGTGLKPLPVSPPTYQPSPTTSPVNQPEPAAPESPQSPTWETPAPETPALSGQILLALLGIGGTILALFWLHSQGRMTALSRWGNAQITVTKLQIALLASAREIQSHLSHLSLHAEFDTPEGLAELLQDSALLLLRHSDDWTYGQGISQTVETRKKAMGLFRQFSIQERSKLKTETLHQGGGKIPFPHSPHPGQENQASDPAAYIVVTLLLGMEDDQPLLSPIHSQKELESALQQVAALSPDELFGVELLWSPQEATERLSEDDLLTQYNELIKI
jgi:uncharacterized membrane protein